MESFVLDKIGKKEKALLAAHLEKCGECSKRVQEEREILTGIRRFGRLEMKRRLKIRLKRDRGRRFEWTHVASLAAAIVVMFGAVFVIRSFLDFKQDKTVTREIILTENREEKPVERALWIIGRVVEIKEDIAYETEPEEKQNRSFAARLSETPEPIAKSDSKYGKETLSRNEAYPAKTEGTIIEGQKKAELQDIAGNKIKGGPVSEKQLDLESPAAAPSQTQESAKLITQDKIDSSVPVGSVAARAVQSTAPKAAEPSDNIVSGTKSPEPESKSGSAELSKIAAARPSIEPIAKDKFDFRDKNAKQRSLTHMKRGRQAKNVTVRRGDMKDLPVSMRTTDPSAIQTKLERTQQGVLLTFYSAAIKDTAATFVEAVTQDSIIVSFSNKQIAYRIPGGLSGGM